MLLALMVTAVLVYSHPVLEASLTDEQRLQIAVDHIENALVLGNDRWSGQNTPLLPDGINVITLGPTKLVFEQDGYTTTRIIHNLASQQTLLRAMVGLSRLTGNPCYEDRAKDMIRYHFDHLTCTNGLLYWGGHQYIDLITLNGLGPYEPDNIKSHHELKTHYPFLELMWQVDPDKTAILVRSLWEKHVDNWGKLYFNRHAPYDNTSPPVDESVWPSSTSSITPHTDEDGGLTFSSTGYSLVYAATELNRLSGETGALLWAEHLHNAYMVSRHPDTGLGGFLLYKPSRIYSPPPLPEPLTGLLTYSSYGDRAENQYGESGSSSPDDDDYNPIKGKYAYDNQLMARESWHYTTTSGDPNRYLMMLYLGETFPQFLTGTFDEMRAVAEYAYDPSAQHFRRLWADGTDVTGLRIPRTGYYGSIGSLISPRIPDVHDVMAYTRAYRLSSNTADRQLFWETARSMADRLGWGDIGTAPGVAVSLNASNGDQPEIVLAMLELYKISPHLAYLNHARTVANRMVEYHWNGMLFVRGPNGVTTSSRDAYTRFSRLEPYAIIALEAQLRDSPDLVPPYVGEGVPYLHGDGLTDNNLFWNIRRSGGTATVYATIDDGMGQFTGFAGKISQGTLQSDWPRLRFNSEAINQYAEFDGFPTFSGEDSFTIIVTARMYDTNRFLCGRNYFLSRSEFRMRGADGFEMAASTGISSSASPYTIAITYSGGINDETKTLKVYVNGVLNATTTTTGIPLSGYPAQPLRIGRSWHGTAHADVSVEDEIRFHPYAMSDTEVYRDFTMRGVSVRIAVSPSGSGGGSVNGLSGDYSPDDGAITYVAEPFPGYRFTRWSGDIGSNDRYDGTLSITPDENRNVIAYFNPIIRVYRDGVPHSPLQESGAAYKTDTLATHFATEDMVEFDPELARFEDEDAFTWIVRTALPETTRYLCTFRYHLARNRFQTRGTDAMVVNTGIGDDAEHVYAITYAGSAGGTKELKVYTDGSLADQTTTSGSPLSSYSSKQLRLGGTHHGANPGARAVMADPIHLFTRVLTESEIQDMSGPPNPRVELDDLTAYAPKLTGEVIEDEEGWYLSAPNLVEYPQAPVAFGDNSRFTIVVYARMLDTSRFLCTFRYHLSRLNFTLRGIEHGTAKNMVVNLGIGDSNPKFIAIVYDGRSEDSNNQGLRRLRAYVDGSLVNEVTASGAWSPFGYYPQAKPLRVGGTWHGSSPYSTVKLLKTGDNRAPIQFFNEALSESELEALRQSMTVAQ